MLVQIPLDIDKTLEVLNNYGASYLRIGRDGILAAVNENGMLTTVKGDSLTWNPSDADIKASQKSPAQ